MNQNQGKASPKISRAGLAKFRPLTPSDGKSESQKRSRSNLPNGWYFNEKHEKSFWNEIEDSLSIERQEKIEQTNKQTDYQTQMEDTSNRLQTLVNRFDDIDQNALLAMMQIAEDDDNNDEIDANQFLDSSKTQIVNFMTEMLDISEAQQSLVENLQSWLTNLLNNDSFLEHEKKEQPDEPNKKQVYNFLESIVDICSEKTEKAQSLHNDVSDFWKKQVATFKRIIYRKDEEISKLKVLAEKGELLSSKKKGQKQLQKQKQKEEELIAKNQQIENQLQTIEEQKSTIEKLRKDLQASQASAAAAFATNSTSNDGSKMTIDRDNSMSNFKVEAEAKFSLLNERIQKLTNENEKINSLLNEERNKTKNISKTLEEKELYIQELEANNQKNLRLLALEQEKTVSPTPPPDVPSENDDRLLEIVQMQENLRLLKQQHQEELVRQQETLREKFLVEKQKILDAMSSSENGHMVKEIIDDYENKLTLQKEEFDKLTADIIRSWGAKLDILTRQYENRIKALNTSHETEIIGITNNAQYELRKKEIQLEEEFNKNMLEESRERKNRDELLQAQINHLKVNLEYAKSECSKLRYIARSYSYKNPDIKKDFDAIPHHNEEEEEEEHLSVDAEYVSRETKLIEKQSVRYQILRDSTEEQTKWLLTKQKEAFEKEIGQMTENHQKDIRSLMMKIQDSISKLTIDEEDPISINDALQLVADIYIKMNEQVEESEKLEQPMMPLEEANDRIKIFADQVQELKLQLSSKSRSKGLNDDETDLDDLENQLLQLKQRNEVLENLTSGNTKGAIESMMKIEKELRKEIAFKDALIEQLQQKRLNPKLFCDLTESIIFHIGGDTERQEEEEKPQIPLQRSMPDFLVLTDITSNLDPKPPIKSHIMNNQMKVSVSQEFHYDLMKDEPFLKSQPEIVPVILQLKNGEIKENRPNKLSISEGVIATSVARLPQRHKQALELKKQDGLPPKAKSDPISPLNSPKPNMQVRTNINKENLGNEKPNAKFSGRYLVETSVQNDLSKPSIFNSIDSTKLIIQSDINAYTVPPKPTKPSKPPVIKRSRDLVYGIILELQPAPPPKPIVIEPDKQLLQTIKELQERLLEIEKQHEEEKNKHENEHENKEKDDHAKREDMFTQMRIAIIDSSNKMIKRQKEIIAELQNRKPEVIYQTQIIRVPDVELPPLEPINNYNNYYNQEHHKHHKDKKKDKKMKKSDHGTIQISSITSFDVYKTLPPVNVEEDEEQKRIMAEQERKEKLRQLYPPPVYDRPPPTPVILDLVSQIDDENIDDPFSASIQTLAAIIRFISNFNDNESHILTTLQNDTNAYEAFLTATCSDDESALQYLKQVKEDEGCFSKNILQIEQLNQLQMKLLKILKMSKKRAKGMAQEIQECRTIAAANELSSQQSILKEVQNDKNLDPKKANLIILQKLESSLAVIDNLCLALTSEEQARHAVLTKRVKDFMQQVEQQKQILPANIDNLIENVQSFIASIKPSSAKTLKEIISSATKAEFDDLNKEIKALKDSLKRYKKKYSQEQANSETLELQIKTLRTKLNEEKELNQNAISLYQSQIAMLKSLFNTLNIDASKDPLGIAEAVRNEVLSLQHLLGTSTSERDVLKTKVADLEEILANREKHIQHMMNEIEEINQKNIDLEATIVEYKKEMMFHSSDIETLKKEKEADIAIGTKHLMQLQELMQKNQEVIEQKNEIEKKMTEMKDKIRKLKEENENLEIQVTLSRFTSVKSHTTSIATQTILRLVGKRQDNERSQSQFHRLSPFQSPQQNQSNASSPLNQSNTSPGCVINNSNENDKTEIDEDLPQHEKVVPDSVPPLQNVPQSSLNKNETEHQNSPNSQVNITEQNNGENIETEEQIEEEEFNDVATDFDWEIADNEQSEVDTFSPEFPQVGKDDFMQHQRFSPDEKAPEKVHRPLHLKKYKKILSKINKRPTTATTNATPKSAKQRPVTPSSKSSLPQTPHSAVSKTGRPLTATSRPKTPNNQQQQQDENTLAIGHSVQGHRALAGQLGKIKPTITGRTALAMKAAFCQHPTRVLPIESAHNYKFNNNNTNNVTPKPKKTFQNGEQIQPTFPTAPNFITEYNNAEPPETIRITRIDYAHNDQEINTNSSNYRQIEDDGPIILPIERITVSCDPTSVSGPIAKSARPFDLAEFERLTAKLQNRIQEILVSLNKKDGIINDMKKKYAELFGDRQRCEIKLVRLMDSLKRTEIRCENAQTRLEIVMKELNLRDEDNKELKKEIIRLRTLTGPATSTLAAVKESHMKQMQLKREKQKKKMVLIAAMSAIGSTTDKDVQKHLGKILENTQRSIARLEIKRRKYKEEERKQVYAALSAISLINDGKPENETFHRFALMNYDDVDEYENQSKMSQNKATIMRSAWNYKANSFNHNNVEPIVFKNYENPDLNRKFPSYNHAMEMIDRIQPPLSVDERRIILRGDMTEEIAAKIAQFDNAESVVPVLSGTKIDV